MKRLNMVQIVIKNICFGLTSSIPADSVVEEAPDARARYSCNLNSSWYHDLLKYFVVYSQ